MLYPNGQRALTSPGTRVGGLLAGSGTTAYSGIGGARFNGTANFAKTASKPEGYAPYGAWVMPIKAGGMGGIARVTMDGSGSLLQGGPMEGTGSMAWTTPDCNLSLVVSMEGTATITFTGNSSDLKLVIGMDGTGTMTLTGAAGLSMIVPFDGTGVMSLIGTGDLRGQLSMDGAWTPFSALSPEGLAAAVWGAVAATNNEAGTMGSKVNSAASGGVDYGALAGAVRTELQAELLRIVEIAKIHGLVIGADLVVTPTSRTAGDVVQTITDATGTTTVTRA